MRKYPHKPNENDLRETWQESLKDYQAYTEKAEAARLSRNENFFKIRCNKIWDLACLTYAFESPGEQVRQLLAVACSCAESAVEFGAKLDPALYMRYLSLAILCQQERFRKSLEEMQRQRYTNPDIESDEVFYLAAEAMASLSAGRAVSAQEITGKALARVKGGQVDNVARAVMEPVLLLEAAIANKDTQNFESATAVQYEKFRSSYSQRAARGHPSGLLDVRSLAMLALARQHGLETSISNIYMPRDLIEETA